MKTIKELATRYGMTPQGVRKFLRNNLDAINVDGEHARQVGRNWKIDDVALTRLDELRGVSKTEPKVSSDFPVVETSSQVDRMSEQIARLSELLVLTQVEFSRRQAEMSELMTQLKETQAQLAKLLEKNSETKETPESPPKKSFWTRFKFWD